MKQIRIFWKTLTIVILTLYLAALTGCGSSTVYVRGTSEALHLTEGQLVPYDGWLLQDEALVDLLQKLEKCN